MSLKTNNTCAVIVTYNPNNDRVISLIKGLEHQSCDAIVIDNSTYKNGILEANEGCFYISLGGNKGIAEAQNIGITECLKKAYKYIIFFDQDSKIENDFIASLKAPMENNQYEICAPVFYDEQKGFEYAITDIKKNGRRVKHYSHGKNAVFTTSTVISSGTIVCSDIFNKVGVMDSALFIDYVDTEWCLRCFSHGIKVHVIPQAKMLHSIGDKSFDFMGFCVPVHSANRRYYRVRNSIHLVRYPHVPKLLAAREVLFSVVHSFLLILTQKSKKEYAYTFIAGLLDGLRNVRGENPRVHKK